jgi:hypothetical protein
MGDFGISGVTSSPLYSVRRSLQGKKRSEIFAKRKYLQGPTKGVANVIGGLVKSRIRGRDPALRIGLPRVFDGSITDPLGGTAVDIIFCVGLPLEEPRHRSLFVGHASSERSQGVALRGICSHGAIGGNDTS